MRSSFRTRSRRRTLGGVVGLAAGAAMLLGITACAPAAAPDALNTDSYETSLADWRMKVDDCMLEAGFDLGSGSDGDSTAAIDTSQIDMAAFEKAYAGCFDKIGDAPIDENMPTPEEMFDAQLVFAKCMREAGYDYPDPVKESGMTPAFGPETDPNVVEACGTLAYDVEDTQ